MKEVKDIHCSGLNRPMTCIGSLFFDLPRQPTNAAAEEGTAAGEYLQHILEGTPVGTHAKNKVAYNDDMKFYIPIIADRIIQEANGPVLCETKIDWQTRSGLWIKGKYDASFTVADDLYIDDLKYGWTLVDPFENWQLIGYAIGEIMRRGQPFRNIVMRIHQPRPHHEDGPMRSWTINYEQLIEYKEKIEELAQKVVDKNISLVTSSSCKYCPAAAAACPAFNKSFYVGVDYVMDHFTQDNIDEREIGHQLSLLQRITEVLKIKSDSLSQLAIDRLSAGKLIPNYIMEKSYSNRSWKEGVSPEVIEALTGIKVTEQIMLSPAKAEKIGVSKELTKSFTEVKFLGQKLKKCDTTKLGNKIFNKGENL